MNYPSQISSKGLCSDVCPSAPPDTIQGQLDIYASLLNSLDQEISELGNKVSGLIVPRPECPGKDQCEKSGSVSPYIDSFKSSNKRLDHHISTIKLLRSSLAL